MPASDAVHQGRRPAEHRLEHHEQQGQQDQQAAHRMQQDRVDLAGQGVGPLGRADAGLHDPLGLARGAAQFGGVGRMPGVFAERSGVGLNLDGGDQIVDAALARGDRGDDRHAQFGAQRLQIDPQALTLGDVVHVQRQNHRTPDGLQLQN